MTRRLPIVPTIIVAFAAAIMIALGVWQLQRAREKEQLIARYAAAEKLPPITFPTAPLSKQDLPLFRSATAVCLKVLGKHAVAGQNRDGEPGYSQIVDCAAGGPAARVPVEVGWSKNPNAKINWAGGPVSGIIAPDARTGMRLVAASAPPGLAPSAPPSISTIPNNHRSYAGQWFAFAGLALLIYGLAVRKRLKERAGR